MSVVQDACIVTSFCVGGNQIFVLLGFAKNVLGFIYRRFGTIYRSHIQGSSSPRRMSKHLGTQLVPPSTPFPIYEGWNFNSGNYLFTTDTK